VGFFISISSEERRSMTTLVMKFGGTSVGSTEALAQVADIVLKQAQKWDRLVVVVSAMSGVTDALIQGATTAASSDRQTYLAIATELRARHCQVIDALLESDGERASLLAVVDEYLDGFIAFCHSVHILGEVTPRAMDAITSLGERTSAAILAALLRQQGFRSEAVDATELIVTDDSFQKAVPLMEATRTRVSARLVPLLDRGTIPVVTGFIGGTEEGVTTTLGRGGSDYSAAILGACLDSDEVWIWTDVDGVMTADPRLVPEARTLPELSYAEAAELCYFGAKVLHPKTILPAVERGIPLRIVNTFNPSHPGTLIVAKARSSKLTVKGIASIKGLSLITVEGRGMLGVPGIAARVFTAVAQEDISVLMISQSSSEQNICFVIQQEAVERALNALEAAFELELAHRNVDRIWAQNEVAIVAVVGAGMKGTPGIAAKVFGNLGKHGINVISIAQGSSEYNISFVVDEENMEKAVRYIHQEFGLGRDKC
jgi:aspartate kinase